MALCLHLAFWTGGDARRMDALFRQSGLMREKWDDVHYADGATYGEQTIERALGMVDDVYEPDSTSDEDGAAAEVTESPTMSSHGTGSDGQHRPIAMGSLDESVYLEERNRLLCEKVHSLETTIERKDARIERLEREVEQVREQLTLRTQFRSERGDSRTTVGRVMRWLTDR